ncbi:MAG: hypothetical protein SOW23_08855, partial [Eubacteriales bacterium]|nr:hypothetical protein [Eubacteriales bacterium]
ADETDPDSDPIGAAFRQLGFCHSSLSIHPPFHGTVYHIFNEMPRPFCAENALTCSVQCDNLIWKIK